MTENVLALPKLGGVATVTRATDIMHGLQAVVCGFPCDSEEGCGDVFIRVEFHQKMVGDPALAQRLHLNSEGYYDGLKPERPGGPIPHFVYQPESLREDMNGYTVENKTLIG